MPLITVSIGALAERSLYNLLLDAANAGGTKLHLSSGAIGGLDAISSARHGSLESVTNGGRKPPQGWRGSRAEEVKAERRTHAVERERWDAEQDKLRKALEKRSQ